MLSDRPYTRGNDPSLRTSALTWLVAALVAAFALEFLLSSAWFGQSSPELFRRMAVTVSGLRAGWVWTLATHGLIHSTTNLLHIVGVIMGLVIFGRGLVAELGPKRFLGVYFFSLSLGALTWAAANWQHGGMHTGSAAGVYGLMTLFACFFPNREMSFLLFFVFPVTIKPKHLIVGLGAAEFIAFIFYEIYDAAIPFSYAPSAHLGGILAGLAYYRVVVLGPSLRSSAEVVGSAPSRWSNSQPAGSAGDDAVKEKPSSRHELRAEVDRILDKINSSGFTALTTAEKQLLDEVKDQLSRP